MVVIFSSAVRAMWDWELHRGLVGQCWWSTASLLTGAFDALTRISQDIAT